MFRHRGKNRTFQHNLKIASLLSFVAGIVNVTGLFAVHQLTTNVTGHFAFFADEMAQQHFSTAWVYLFYILSFFSGAFFSSLMVEAMLRKNARLTYMVPVSIEIAILTFIGCLNLQLVTQYGNAIACSLLFAMGLQNALVTSLSNAVVRTTHLTGLFTDLGIEVSQLFFLSSTGSKRKTFFFHSPAAYHYIVFLFGLYCRQYVLFCVRHCKPRTGRYGVGRWIGVRLCKIQNGSAEATLAGLK